MGSTNSQQSTFSYIVYYICWLVLNLALLETCFLDSRRNEASNSGKMECQAAWIRTIWSKICCSSEFRIVFTPGCENPRFTYSHFFICMFRSGLGITFWNYPRWAQSNNMFSSRWVQSNNVFLRDGLSQTTTNMSLNHWHKEPNNKF